MSSSSQIKLSATELTIQAYFTDNVHRTTNANLKLLMLMGTGSKWKEGLSSLESAMLQSNSAKLSLAQFYKDFNCFSSPPFPILRIFPYDQQARGCLVISPHLQPVSKNTNIRKKKQLVLLIVTNMISWINSSNFICTHITWRMDDQPVEQVSQVTQAGQVCVIDKNRRGSQELAVA